MGKSHTDAISKNVRYTSNANSNQVEPSKARVVLKAI